MTDSTARLSPAGSECSAPLRSERSRRVHGLLIGAIALIALAVQLYGAPRTTLWYDEFCSLECSTGRGLFHESLPYQQLLLNPVRACALGGAPPWTAIWTSLRAEQHPPLYFILLRAWRGLTGDSELALRGLGAAFSAICVLLIYDVGRSLLAPAPAIWAAAMFALSGPIVEIGLMVRGYTMMLAFVLAAWSALARIESRGPTIPLLLALAGSLLLAMLTHYFALGPALAIGAYSLVRLGASARRRVVSALFIAALLYTAIWGPQLWQQRANFQRNHTYLAEPPQGHAMLVLKHLALLPASFINRPSTSSAPFAALMAAVYALPFVIARRSRGMLALALWISLTVGLVAALDLYRDTGQLTLLRYTIGAAPPIFLVICGTFWLTLRKYGRALWMAAPAVYVAACTFDIPRAYRPNDGDWRLMAKSLASLSRTPADQNDPAAQQPVIFVPGARGEWYANWLYLGLSHYLPSWPGPVVLVREPPSNSLLNELRGYKKCWVVVGPGGDVETMFPTTTTFMRHQELFIGSIHELIFAAAQK